MGSEGSPVDDKWVRNVRESPAATEARELLRVLNESGAPDENTMSDLGKTRREAERAIWILENCDPYVMPQTSLDQAHQSLSAATSQALQYQSTQDAATLATVMGSAEAALVNLASASIPAESAAPAEQLAGLSRAISEQRDAAGRDMAGLVESLRTQVTVVDQQRQTAEQQNADLLARVEQLRAEVDALRQASTTLTTQWQASYTDEQSSRAEQFRALLEEQRSQGLTIVSSLEATTKASLAAAGSSVEDALAVIRDRQAQAEQIVGIISDEALIGEPSKRAAEDKRSAFWWSLGAVTLGLLAAVVAVIAIAKHTSGDRDWIGFALKSLAVVTVGGVSAYAAKQASEHRSAQRDLAHLAVQLAAIKPYLRDMGESARDEVLRDVASKLFGPRTVGAAADEDVVLPPGTLQLVQLLINAAKAK